MKKKTKRKVYLWLPYLSKIEVFPQNVKFEYKGGKQKIKWTKIHSIMIYGESCDLSQDFFEKCAFYKIPIIIHRRNIPRAVIASPTLPPDQENLLSKQILFREKEKKRAYIGKKLLQAKFKGMNWLLPINRDLLYGIFSLDKMLSVESWHAKIYWEKYFSKLGEIKGRREEGNIYKPILDAVSKFLSGIMLRWILYHNLSPYHGFLHKPTDYPALVYDLMEPYRGYFDKVVFDTIKNTSKEKNNETKLTALTIENIKKFLDTKVYVEATRQIVTFQEILHGIVLALRAYLLGNTKRFIVPLPSKPNGGRPIKAGYQLYGHKAGITNFWPETKQIAEEFERVWLI
ncbi:MAG: CRISPR-associated endonuclease Cas1 [Microgenomates group bacterium]